MAAKIIDGKAVSAAVKEQVRQEVEREGLDIGLAVVIVGDDPASRVYVNNKKKACEFCGIQSFEYALPEETTMEQLLELIDTLNGDDKVTATAQRSGSGVGRPSTSRRIRARAWASTAVWWLCSAIFSEKVLRISPQRVI